MTEIRKNIEENGLKMTLHFGTTRFIERIFHQFNKPSTKDCFSYLNNIYLGPKTSLINEFANSESTMNEIERKFYACSKQLESKAKSLTLRYHSNFALNSKGTHMIYYITRIVRPKILVETGVTNGVSTFYIIKALKKNSFGKLISFDISPDVGPLNSDSDRLNWDLSVLSRKRRRDFIVKFGKIGNIYLFLHYGDHAYNWQIH